MALSGSARLECDSCGIETTEDIEANQSPEDIIDQEGWTLTGILLDRLLCPTCAEEEEEE